MVSGIWNKILKKEISKGTSNKKRLINILSFAEDLIKCSIDSNDSIFTLIKMLTDKILFDNTLEVIETFKTVDYLEENEIFSFKNLFIKNLSKEDEKIISEKIKRIAPEKKIEISLATDPIIATVWDREKLPELLSDIGIKSNEWKNTGSHFYNLYLPIGVTFVHTDGNHSTTVGILKRTGTTNIGESKLDNIYDMKELYKIIEFDGINYKYIQSKKIIGQAISFEFGCIFEIGRLVLKNKCSFTVNKIKN